jgi:4-amino-4-deoxy-L-arabinose transferase-like glycosyltransferase
MTAASAPRSAASLLNPARWPAVVLLLLCLVAWLPGALTLPPLDRDESRFAQASKQMVETGNLVDIRFNAGPRYNKPVGIYWLQAAAAEAFGSAHRDQIWVYRLPSLIGGYLALLFAYWCARAFAAPRTALLAAAFLGATLLLSAEAEIATTDAVLLAAILAAQAVLLRVYLAARNGSYKPPGLAITLAGWVAVAAGVLVKGPVILGVLGVTILGVSALDRDWRWLRGTRAAFGIPLALALVLPWVIAIGIESHGAFFQQSLGHDFGNKLVGGQESHGALPGYFLLLASATLWPVTLLALPGVYSALLFRREPVVRYLFMWAAATWLLFELVPTKLPHYILPAYPALAMLAALWTSRSRPIDEPRWERIARYAACLQFLLGAACLAAAAVVVPQKFGGGIVIWVAAGSAVSFAIALTAAVALVRRRAVGAGILAIASALIFYPVVTLGLAPGLAPIWTSPHAAQLVAQAKRPDDPPVVLAGYVEPSLVFLLGSDTRIETAKSAADIAAMQGGLALVEDGGRTDFLTELSSRDTSARILGRTAGFDYSRGKPVQMTLYRVAPALQITTPPAE